MIVVKVGGSLYDHPALGPALCAFVESLQPAEVLFVPGGGEVADAVRALDRTHALGEEAAHWVALRALSVTAAFLERIVGRPTPPAPPPLKGRGENSRIASCASDMRSGSEVLFSPLPFREGGPGGVGPRVLDCYTFAREDESRPGALPHTWDVTTDSIAARAALVFGAERLVLLKSVDVPTGSSWEDAAANGWVDAHFPRVAALLRCPVGAVNFRAKLDAHA